MIPDIKSLLPCVCEVCIKSPAYSAATETGISSLTSDEITRFFEYSKKVQPRTPEKQCVHLLTKYIIWRHVTGVSDIINPAG